MGSTCGPEAEELSVGKDDIQDKFAVLDHCLTRDEFGERLLSCWFCLWVVCEQEMSLLHARVMLDAPRETILRSQLQGMMGKHNSRGIFMFFEAVSSLPMLLPNL